MKLVASIRLFPDAEQSAMLRETLERCCPACTWLAEIGASTGKTRQYDLHHLAYADMRTRFGLAAQVTVRCIGKVADAFKIGDKDEARTFHRHAAQPYDERIFRFLPGQDAVSIWTLAGRQRIPFVCGDRQRDMLTRAKGEVDLMLVGGKWMLAATCDADEAPAYVPVDVQGIDFGVVNIVVDDLGRTHSGAQIDDVRRRQPLSAAAPCRRSAPAPLSVRSGALPVSRHALPAPHQPRAECKAIVLDAERGRSAGCHRRPRRHP